MVTPTLQVELEAPVEAAAAFISGPVATAYPAQRRVARPFRLNRNVNLRTQNRYLVCHRFATDPKGTTA